MITKFDSYYDYDAVVKFDSYYDYDVVVIVVG